MNVNDELIDKLSKLSKLDFSCAESKAEIKSDLTKILNFMEKLNELNTDNITPLVYINEEVNVMRTDEVHYPISKSEALQNAPLKNEDYIKVPKFVKGTKYE